MGSTSRSKIWCLEDSAQNNIYVGLRVWNASRNPGDYCQIYLEGNGADAMSPVRNYILDDNSESSLRVTDANAFTHYYWSASNTGWQMRHRASPESSWTADSRRTEHIFSG